MKKILVFLVSLFFVVNTNAQEMIMTSPDVPSSSTGTIDETMRTTTGIVEGGRDITATGTLKIPIVFVKFADDNATTAHWPLSNELPSWATNFVDTDIPVNNIYLNNNFSKFYDLSSGGNGSGTLGKFQVVGDVYFITLSENRSYYEHWSRKDKKVSEDVIDILDDPSGFNVDFAEYDNWQFKVGGVPYTHTNNPDGILDFMLIYWKDKSISLGSKVGGVAGLGFSGTITKDGINIKPSNGVRGFKSQDFGNEHTIWVSAHEIGHHQFGMIGWNTGSHFNGRADRYGNIQRFGLMTRSEGHQFSAYERYRLGWLDPVIVTTTTSQTVTLNETHKSNTDNAIIIPAGYTSSGDLEEYFLLENYHSTNAYSGANPFLTKSLFNHTISKGIIVYHVSEENFNWPTLSQVDIESAEGLFDWNVVQGASTPSNRLDDLIAYGNSNEANGFDERDTITATAGTTTYSDYFALTPSSSSETEDKKKRRYDSDDWLGDQEDLFSLGYNKVFTKWSNPSSRKDNGNDSYVGFEIVSYNSVTHQYIIKVSVNSSGIQNFSPSKPQNLVVTSDGESPELTWERNMEPDVTGSQAYGVFRNGSFISFVAQTVNGTDPSYIDTDIYWEGYDWGSWGVECTYEIKVKDNTNKISLPSDAVMLSVDPNNSYFLNKKDNNSATENIVAYKLYSNYPNPFNPTTQISYQIPKYGFVNLGVYNTLGQVVATLVNEHQTSGKYSVQFNASNLPSGVYFYKIESGDFIKVNKMLLLR